jgi:MOSC domain-containing protein YiiM
MARILSVSIGKIQNLLDLHDSNSQNTPTGIYKKPISTMTSPELVEVKALGLSGDEQADLRVHGGLEKSVYVYPIEHYQFWRNHLVQHAHSDPSVLLEHGYLGENLTIEGILEEEVFLGDRWKVGSVIFQVTKLREPCFKFNVKMNFKGAARAMIQSGHSGWYLRVLQTGFIQAGDEITVEPGSRQTSIADQNRTLYRLKGQSDLEF